MYSRTTLLEIDVLRVDMSQALAAFKERVLPALREQEGYQGILVLGTPDGKAMLVSLWETEEAAEATAENGFYAGALAEFATLFRAPPGRERYEVLLAETPLLTTA